MRIINDLHNLSWKAEISISSKPNFESKEPVQWQALCQLKAQMNIEHLIKSKVLDKEKDKRIIEIIDSQSLDIKSKNTILIAYKEENLDYKINKYLDHMKSKLSSSNLMNIKRNIINKWIDNQFSFGFLQKNIL